MAKYEVPFGPSGICHRVPMSRSNLQDNVSQTEPSWPTVLSQSQISTASLLLQDALQERVRTPFCSFVLAELHSALSLAGVRCEALICF